MRTSIRRQKHPISMQFISPICRDKFTINDFEFICEVLVSKRHHNNFMLKLLEDQEARDSILDNIGIFRAISEWNKSITISCYLYFYVLVRNTLLKRSIDDRILSDYIAMLLAESLKSYKMDENNNEPNKPIMYLVDLLKNLEQSNPTQQFYIKADIGNYSLYLTGVFPNFLEHRSVSKAAPGIEYYESMGRINFNSIGNHDLAEKYNVENIYLQLGDSFQEIRMALNEMTSSYMHLHQSSEWDKVQNLLIDIDTFDEEEPFSD